MPQHAIVSVRSLSTMRTIAAVVSGKTPGIDGRLSVVSRIDRVNLRIAVWPLVIE